MAGASTKPRRVVDLQERLVQLIAEHNCRANIKLEHNTDGYVVDGSWVHLIVVPSTPGARAYELVEQLVKLEEKLKADTGEQDVLLVPAQPD